MAERYATHWQPSGNALALPISFTILGQPASKANSRQLMNVGKGENRRALFIKSGAALAYEKAAIAQIPSSALLMLDCELAMMIKVYYSSQRSDLDESIILDVLQARYKTYKESGDRLLLRPGVYLNDRQVRERHVDHAIDKERPRAEITIALRGYWQLSVSPSPRLI